MEIRVSIKKIVTACIQETHNTTNDEILLKDYNILFKKQKGVAEWKMVLGGLLLW